MASFFKPPRFLMRERAAGRAVVPESRTVTCYRCALTLTVSGYAESASCPHCAGLLRMLPINITKGHWGSSIMTTESVHIHQDAKAIANIIVASGDILIEGSAHAMCICGGTARLAPTAELKGGIRAATLIIEPGATIAGSIVESPSTALGSIDVDAAARSRPGTGPGAQIEFRDTQLAIAASQIIEPKDHQPIPIRQPYPPRLRVVR